MDCRSRAVRLVAVPSLLGAGVLAAGLGERTDTCAGQSGPVSRAATMIRRTYQPTDAIFPNPERGFYRFVNLTRERDLRRIHGEGYTLIFSYIRLDVARNGPIPASILSDAEAGLEAARAAGLKVILRFAYNNGPYPNPEPDAPKERILEHVRQLRPLFRRNEDVIALVQAGFIGAWGEWHSSTNKLLDDPRDRRAILEALLDALPPSRMTQIRTPGHKQEMHGGPLREKEAFSGTYAARVGHHNDCFLANDTDMGTYPRGEAERWKNYLAEETRFVPMGGETCAFNPPRTDCGSALAEMKRLHFSYINQDYHRRVVAAWTEQGCRAEMDRRLGYRLALVETEVPERLRAGDRFGFRVRLRNDGWAAPFNSRPVFAVIAGDAGRFELALPVRDIRRWEADRDVTIDARLQAPAGIRPGTYRLALWLPDAAPRLRRRPEYAIRLANKGVWEEATGLNSLGDVTVTSR